MFIKTKWKLPILTILLRVRLEAKALVAVSSIQGTLFVVTL